MNGIVGGTSILPAVAGLILLPVSVVIAVWILSKIFSAAISPLRWAAVSTNTTPLINFVSFAVAAYFLPTPLVFGFLAVWNVSNAIVSYVPTLLELLSLQQTCTNLLDVCINRLVLTIGSSLATFLANLFVLIDLGRFPLLDAILLIATWVCLASLFNAVVVSSTAAPQRIFEALSTNYHLIPESTRSNVVFFIILAVGAYLSLTSIIAIPSLLEPPSQEKIEPDTLRTRLNKVVLTDEFEKRFPLEISEDNRLDRNPRYIALKSTSDDSAQAPSTNTMIPFANEQLVKVRNLSQRWANLREDFRTSQSSLVDIAVLTFDLSNKGRRGVRETQDHLLAIELWYHRWWSLKATYLDECKSTIERYSAQTVIQFDYFVSAFSPPRLGSPVTATIPVEYLNGLIKRQNQLESDAIKNCKSQPESLTIPGREDFGTYLGIFGVAAKWLLKTESLSLVLISGLLGFGLLGAACSTVIRNVKTRTTGEPLVPNLASVVIRGASAAILIFLAVYGGLAVFAGSNANPNPYVVLFTCLAAAVFSEDAWTWGAQQFRSRLSNASSSKRQDASNRSDTSK